MKALEPGFMCELEESCRPVLLFSLNSDQGDVVMRYLGKAWCFIREVHRLVTVNMIWKRNRDEASEVSGTGGIKETFVAGSGILPRSVVYRPLVNRNEDSWYEIKMFQTET